MKLSPRFVGLTLAVLAPLLSQCSSSKATGKPPAAVSTSASPAKGNAVKADVSPVTTGAAAKDDLDEYAVVEIADPLEKLNRGTFWLNDKLYLVIFRPVSKGYEKVLPKPVRKGIDNAFENARFPVRFVNCALQGEFKRGGLETGKFLLNTVAGIGGILRPSDRVGAFTDLSEQDTGLTFAKWGMGHGAYVVLPFLGPCSARDGIGLVGDYALNPVNWGFFWGGNHDWTQIPPTANTLRALPPQLSTYDDARRDAIDPYIAVRSAYIQYRDQAVKK